jgi:uncharacterized protein
MILGVISDTHGDTRSTTDGMRLFEAFGVETILHCGDIGSAEVVGLFTGWSTHFVLGNVDYQAPLNEAIDPSNHFLHGRFGELCLAEKKIAFLHGDDGVRLIEAIEGDQFDLVCHGHTHSPRWSVHKRTFILNPGAISRTVQPSVAVLDLNSMSVEHLSL